MKTSYIFIVGVSRSGTSLMRHILNEHDQIAISRENHFMGHLISSEGARQKFRQFGDLREDANVRKLVDYIYSRQLATDSKRGAMSSHWKWLVKRVNRNDFEEKILASDRSERAIFASLMDLFAEKKGKAIKGEKTPAHVRYVPTLLDWFPGAKVIHMLRDPRGIYVSELRRRYEEANTTPFKQLKKIYPLFKLFILLQTTIFWLESVYRYHQYKKQFSDCYYLMKFEDMVRDPEKHIRDLCQFLGIEFQQGMLDQMVVSSGYHLGQAGFDTTAADRWRKHIDPVSNAWFKLWFRGYLNEFKYSA